MSVERVGRNVNGAYIDLYQFYNKVIYSQALPFISNLITESKFYKNLDFLLNCMPELPRNNDVAKQIFRMRYIKHLTLSAIAEDIGVSRGFVDYWLGKYIRRILMPTIQNKIIPNPLCWGIFVNLPDTQREILKQLFAAGVIYKINPVSFIAIMTREQELTGPKKAKTLLEYTDESFVKDTKINYTVAGNMMKTLYRKLLDILLRPDEIVLRALYHDPNVNINILNEFLKVATDDRKNSATDAPAGILYGPQKLNNMY